MSKRVFTQGLGEVTATRINKTKECKKSRPQAKSHVGSARGDEDTINVSQCPAPHQTATGFASRSPKIIHNSAP